MQRIRMANIVHKYEMNQSQKDRMHRKQYGMNGLVCVCAWKTENFPFFGISKHFIVLEPKIEQISAPENAPNDKNKSTNRTGIWLNTRSNDYSYMQIPNAEWIVNIVICDIQTTRKQAFLLGNRSWLRLFFTIWFCHCYICVQQEFTPNIFCTWNARWGWLNKWIVRKKKSNTQNELTNISLCIEMAQAPQHAIYK